MAGEARNKVVVRATSDGTDQPMYVMLPVGHNDESGPKALVVVLHPWSADLEHRQTDFEDQAMGRGWILLYPNFRGQNDHPDACGSLKAQQDILDSVAWAEARHNVDSRRIYLTGASGGGHMAMLMAGRHPDIWAAASAWVGISDLVAWHRFQAGGAYGEMIRKSCGGRPGDSAEVDEEYRQRSPLGSLAGAVDLPLDIAAGLHDGHHGSVPIHHSLDAFNVVAKAVGEELVADDEIEQLGSGTRRLAKPRESDLAEDPALGRRIYLRRQAAAARVTIFEGHHEGIAPAAFDWLARHNKSSVGWA